MIGASDIRRKIADLVAGNSLDEFEDWFAQSTWNAHLWGDPEFLALVHFVELRLSEHSAGHLTEQQMYDELKDAVQNYRAPLASPVPLVRATSEMHLSFVKELRSEQVVGIRLSWESV